MRKLIIKGYDATINAEGEEYSVLIGVDEEGHPEEAYWDTWVDHKIYYFLTAQELEEIQAGDLLADEDFLVEIDKDNPHIFEVEYNEEEFENA